MPFPYGGNLYSTVTSVVRGYGQVFCRLPDDFVKEERSGEAPTRADTMAGAPADAAAFVALAHLRVGCGGWENETGKPSGFPLNVGTRP